MVRIFMDQTLVSTWKQHMYLTIVKTYDENDLWPTSEEFNFLSCMHVYEISIPSFSNEAMYV